MASEIQYHPLPRPLSPIIESPPTTPQKPIPTTQTIPSSSHTDAAPFADQGRDQAVRKSVTWSDLISYRAIDLGEPDTEADVGRGERGVENQDAVTRLNRADENHNPFQSSSLFSHSLSSNTLSLPDEGFDLPPLQPAIVTAGAAPNTEPGRRKLHRPRSLILGPKDLFLRALSRLHIGSDNPAASSRIEPSNGSEEGWGNRHMGLVYSKKTEVEVSHHPHRNPGAEAVEIKGILNRRPDDQSDRPGVEGLPSSSTRSFPPISPRLDSLHHDSTERSGNDERNHRRSYSISIAPSGSKDPPKTSRRRRLSWTRAGRKDQGKEWDPTKTIRTSVDDDLDLLGRTVHRDPSPFPQGSPVGSVCADKPMAPGPSPSEDIPKRKTLPLSGVASDIRPRPALRVQGNLRTGSRRTVSDPTLPTRSRLFDTSFSTDDDGPLERDKRSELDGKDRHTIVRMIKDELTSEEDGERVQNDLAVAKPAPAAPGRNDQSKRADVQGDGIDRFQVAWDALNRSDEAQHDIHLEPRRRAMSLDKDLPRLPPRSDKFDMHQASNRRFAWGLRRSKSGTPAVSHPENTGSFHPRGRPKSYQWNQRAAERRGEEDLSDAPSYTVTTRPVTPMPSQSSAVSLLLASALLSQQASQILLDLSSITQASGRGKSAQEFRGEPDTASMSEFKRRMEDLAREGSEAGKGLMDCLLNAHAVSPAARAASVRATSPTVDNQGGQVNTHGVTMQEPRARWSADTLSSIIFPKLPEISASLSAPVHPAPEQGLSILDTAEATIQELQATLNQLRLRR